LRGAQRSGGAPLPTHLPLTRRLHRAYAERIHALPPDVRRLLLLGALDDAGDLRPLFASIAGSAVANAISAAEQAGLLPVDATQGRVTFRHPVVRASVLASSTGADRLRAHRDLAGMSADGERTAWHLAQASVHPDPEVSSLLEQSARRNLLGG